ncbi:MAG: PorT family protein [Bacteroidota bacterium]|nr:PorT family protein [Bacteroidota bacterium]
MQYPSNDMDDLFRRAAEAYPLNTSSADWEKVHARLSEEESREQPPPKGRLRWLYVLLPFMFLGLRLNDVYRTNPLQATRFETNTQNATSDAYSGSTGLTESTVIAKKTTGALPNNPVQRRQAAAQWLPRSRTFGLSAAHQQQQPVWNAATARDDQPSGTPRMQANAIAVHPLETFPGAHEPVLPVMAASETASLDSLSPKTTDPEEPKAQQPGSRKKRLYAGIVAGPDMSTVKFQQFSNTGFQAGVMVGYAFSDRFAVEAGALSSRKNYSSDGEYYKPEAAYAPPSYAKVVAVDGNCRMIEIPISLRYTVRRQKKHTWFAAAGFSSYLMQQEDYSLDYLYPSSGNIATHDYTYTDKDQYWLAALQVSFGYSTKLSRYANLRVEPYYALPLKGMGHGRMPVSSFGIRIGLTVPQF